MKNSIMILPNSKPSYPFFKYIYLSVFLTFILSGCAKETLENSSTVLTGSLEGLRRPEIKGFQVNSMSYHSQAVPAQALGSRKLATTISGIPGSPDPIAGVFKDGPGIIDPQNREGGLDPILFFRQRYKSRMFTIADQSMALNIFPGAILDGRSLEGVFSPRMLQGISSGIRPVTISTSMPVSGSAVARTALPRPISERALSNAALTDLENLNPGGVGAASLQLEIDTFKVFEELKTVYGYNKSIDVFLASANTVQQGENHLIKSKSAMKVKFFQENYTIDLDIPNTTDELFDPTGLDMATVTGGVQPVFVRSVTYGRMGIMVIESTYSSEKLYSAVYKQLGILRNLIGIDRNLTEEEKTIINDADIKVKYTGIGADADGMIKLNGLAGFIDVLSANKTYSKESPGVPIAFQLAYLGGDHASVEAPFQINYGPFNMPYAKIVMEGQSDNTGTLPFFRKADVYVNFFKDPNGNVAYKDVPDFVPFKVEETVNSTYLNNYVPTYSTRSSSSDIFLKNGAERYFLGNKVLEYFVKLGSDANTSRDEHTFRLVPNGYFSIATGN